MEGKKEVIINKGQKSLMLKVHTTNWRVDCCHQRCSLTAAGWLILKCCLGSFYSKCSTQRKRQKKKKKNLQKNTTEEVTSGLTWEGHQPVSSMWSWPIFKKKKIFFCKKIQFSGKWLPHLKTVPVASPQSTCLREKSKLISHLRGVSKLCKRKLVKIGHSWTSRRCGRRSWSCTNGSGTLCPIKHGVVRQPLGKGREIIPATAKTGVETQFPTPGNISVGSAGASTRLGGGGGYLTANLNEPALISEIWPHVHGSRSLTPLLVPARTRACKRKNVSPELGIRWTGS